MDQFAVIRAQARALREEAGLADSMTAIEIVRTAAAHLGLVIRPHAPDYHELEGAHGVLDRDFGLILVRDDLPDEVLAEVIAHEIGHFRVHQGAERGYYTRSDSNGGDPNQRIESYGIKERREAQANSFARELVLPRTLARRLFVGGRNATHISTDLKIRYETTLQQLADGLLLPDVESGQAPADAAPKPCDGSQQRAVDHRGTPFLLRAGPGTGKTKTLTARIVSLLQEGVPAKSILALTFSNKAALELSERIQRAVGPSAVNIWTGTFHAFGLDTIRKHHDLFGVSNDPKVVDASESVAMLEEALPALDLRHYLNLYEPALTLRDMLRAISRAKDELWTPERYFQAAENMLRTAATDEEIEAAEKAREVALVYQYYQRQLTEEGAVDYGDLIMRPVLMMREDPDFRDLMRSRFTHVHVDEYQDVNRASAMLVREMVSDGNNLWVVGDARQSIYRFRGASAANIARFGHDYATGKEGGLEENYRSTREIVDVYTSFGGTMSVSRFAGPAGLRAVRGGGGEPPAVFACADAAAEMDVLAGSIRGLEATGIPLRSQTILARSNGSLARFAEELEARDLPVLYLGPLFDRAEVKDLLSLLSIVVDDAGTGLVRVARFPEYSVPLEDVLAVVARARSIGARVVGLLPQVGTIPELSPQGRDGLLVLACHLEGTDRGTTPWLALSRYLFDASDYVRTVLAGSFRSDDLRRVAVRQLLDALRAMPLHGSGIPIRRALDRVRHLILLADERDLRHLPPELDGLDGVRLMTIHASKGLEFDAVHLPGLYAGAVPAPNRPPACPPPAGMLGEEDENAHEAEEEAIFFVAMSRARSYLRLYRPRSRDGKNSNPSRFLDRVPAAAGHPVAGVARTRPPTAFPLIISPAAPVELTARDVESYVACPRRFFYERVLELSRRARAGAYLDAHGCLQRVFAYVRGLDPGVDYDREQAVAVFEEAWTASGLDQHPFGSAYRRLTLSMLDRLHASAAGANARPGQLSTMVGGETIGLSVDRVLHAGGTHVVSILPCLAPTLHRPARNVETIARARRRPPSWPAVAGSHNVHCARRRFMFMICSMNNPQSDSEDIRPTDPDMKWTGWALDMLRSSIEVDDRTKRMILRQHEQTPRGADAPPDYALMQSRLSRSMRLSIAMTERIRVDFGMRKKKRKDSGEEERRQQRREQAAEAVAEAAAAPDVAEDVEHVRAVVRETLVEDEVLDAQLDSLSPEEFVREVCRKIGRPPNPAWLPRGWDDVADTEAGDTSGPPDSSVESVAADPPAAAGWARPPDESGAGRPMPEPSIPDSS